LLLTQNCVNYKLYYNAYDDEEIEIDRYTSDTHNIQVVTNSYNNIFKASQVQLVLTNVFKLNLNLKTTS